MQFKQGANQMNRTLLGISLIVILSLGLTGCQLETAAAQASEPQLIVTPTPTEIRCGQSQPEHAATCQQWEEGILATTVRIQLSGWLASAETNTATWTRLDTEIGHGTVKDGRYLKCALLQGREQAPRLPVLPVLCASHCAPRIGSAANPLPIWRVPQSHRHQHPAAMPRHPV